jgi:peptide-methionine (R)-S-oxide reductase
MRIVIDRRSFVVGAATVLAPLASLAAPDPFSTSPWRKLADAEWKRRLTPASYDVLRHEGTEIAFTSPLNGEHRRGTFLCIGCELPLFKSQWKFDSGTGWPSFYTVLTSAIGRKTDFKIGYPRTAYFCARCLGHQGHVFGDGPKPTGLRYCNNGVALRFVAA